jgi:hypothetical protein
VLFIHGFTSGDETWKLNKTSLPALLLVEPEIKNNYDMAYVSYYTKLMDFQTIRRSFSILKQVFGKTKYVPVNKGVLSLADVVFNEINLNFDQYENIIIVGHSMGGLISKYCILRNIESFGENQKIKLFISLATPHLGSNWGHLGKALFNNLQIEDLTTLSATLDELNREWDELRDKIPNTIYFYGKDDSIVSERSAVAIGADKLDTVACDDDHFSITKPDRPLKNCITGIKRQLIRFIQVKSMEESLEIKKFQDDGSLDKHNFVVKLLVADVHSMLIKSAKETYYNAEYATRAILAQGTTQEKLDGLYVLVKDLYREAFVRFCKGELKSSDDLVLEVKEQISSKNDTDLASTATHQLMNAFQKTGMLHQLANDFEEDIWWAKEHSVENFEELRRAKGL